MWQKTYVFYLQFLLGGILKKRTQKNRFWDSTFCHHHCVDRAPPRAPGCKAQVVKVYDVQIHGDNGPGQQSSIANTVRCVVPKADCLIWHHQHVINTNHCHSCHCHSCLGLVPSDDDSINQSAFRRHWSGANWHHRFCNLKWQATPSGVRHLRMWLLITRALHIQSCWNILLLLTSLNVQLCGPEVWGQSQHTDTIDLCGTLHSLSDADLTQMETRCHPFV